MESKIERSKLNPLKHILLILLPNWSLQIFTLKFSVNISSNNLSKYNKVKDMIIVESNTASISGDWSSKEGKWGVKYSYNFSLNYDELLFQLFMIESQVYNALIQILKKDC